MKKKVVTVILMMCMTLCFVACGNNNGSDKDSQKPNTENTSKDDTEEESEKSGVTYTIKVVDENNNPIGGMMVQLCKNTCMPKLTNAQGLAEFSVEAIEDGYQAAITSLPEGYKYEGEKYIDFKSGETEVVIVITSDK